MRAARLVVSLLVLALLLAACGGQPEGAPTDDDPDDTTDETSGEPDTDATVVIASDEDEWPAQGDGPNSSTWAYPLNANVFETLIVLDADYSLQPGLAEDWELVEPATWRFHLREGVTFHDGTEMTAADVEWSIERVLQKDSPGPLADSLTPETIVAVDDYTVEITPDPPNMRLPEQILHPNNAIVPEGVHNDDEEVVGTGRFRIVEYRENEVAVVERNEDYWGEPAQVAGIEFRFLPDPQTRIEALRSEEADVALEVPPDAVATLEADDRFTIARSEPGRNQLIYINITGEEPFDLGADPAIREAVSFAIDREAYVETAFAGEADPGRWMAPGRVLGEFADMVEPVPYEPGTSREVLEDAGWVEGDDGIRERDGRRLELVIIGWPEVTLASFQLIQAQLADVGIDLEIRQASDRPTYNNFYGDTQFDLDLEVPNQNDGNPAFLPVLRMFSEREAAFRFAPGGEFDEWARTSNAAPTTEEVQEASAEMMRILIHDEHIVVPLAGVYRIYATGEGVDLPVVHPSRLNQSWAELTVTQ